MNIKLHLSAVVAAGVLLLSGCNSTSEGSSDTRVAKADNADLVCESRPTTGSNLRKKRCMSRALAKEVRKETREAMRRVEVKGRAQSHTK
ncbi:hypothetical protein PSECIP111951_03364 [Pseudoalteromonas holothuriae]|uniref:Uncharacterized protein n=1 Tax=Pseudoalteromonas holothuriae TaxID=2963714 RepID=A0A9W4R379_9GAMM|nr:MULTISPECIES: hypothetical protein [unclassified Pseudoalteromonas]CAH9064487.1 hypothetical protein PSECIP111854_03460 [Pseudoalteromonas sp. CIP111854]CAH9065445.1 hypothetical protein PSECIP111951_03364 [Pseudoalteromonas sp. CIP111951]